jgi:hypothetical protein
MFHTVYNSFESGPSGRDYIGKHSTDDPYDDYRGSFKDKSFNPDNKIVIAYATSPEGAVWLEQRFQKVFNVVEDNQFANRSYQTSSGFDTTGTKWVRTQEQIENLKRSFNKPETKAKRSVANRGENNPRYGVREEEEAKKARLAKVSEYYSTPEGFQTASIKTLGTVWYHLPDGTEKRFRKDPGFPWILGRNSDLGEIVKHNLDPAAGGKVTGKLPWWYNPVTGERKRQINKPGEGWEPRRGPNNTRRVKAY